MSGTDRPPLRISDALVAIGPGISRRTVQRRCDAWERGDRTPWAIRSGRVGRNPGERRIDALDVQRVRLQLRGELGPGVTTEQYAQMVAGQQRKGGAGAA